MLLALAGCVADQRDRRLAQPMEKAIAPYGTGSIFKAGFNEHPFYEDRRTRNVGDILVMTVPDSVLPPKPPAPASKAPADPNADPNADTSGSQDNQTSIRSDDGEQISFIPPEALVGKIPLTVMKVLDDGKLLVAGGKQVVDYDGYDRYVRITGEVDPANIKDGNSVLSTAMTDVRMRVDEVRIHSDGTAINFSEGQNTFGGFFHSMQP